MNLRCPSRWYSSRPAPLPYRQSAYFCVGFDIGTLPNKGSVIFIRAPIRITDLCQIDHSIVVGVILNIGSYLRAIEARAYVVDRTVDKQADVEIMNASSRTSNAEQGNRHGGTARTQDSTGSETPSKKLACDGCRDRKVRCDRGHPACARCSRLGQSCLYSGPSKPAVTKVDLSRILTTLVNRLGVSKSPYEASSCRQC